VDLRVGRFDEASGRVELSFKVLSEASLAGDMQDEAVQWLLASALQYSTQDADRLQAVGWLAAQPGRDETQLALIAALKNDSNPGMRLKAIEALASSVPDWPPTTGCS
jgi:alkylhydroperoxidase/carboxymuconolactone decarboxylase family protein YurZ